MPLVELIYDMDCPNIQYARTALLEGFSQAGLQPSWTEWDRMSPESPTHVRRYGSPTILVDGQDVAGAEPVENSNSCRIYADGLGGLRGFPSVEGIASALRNSGTSTAAFATGGGRVSWRLMASLPSVGAALLPVGVCPACWPAYAGILWSLGLGALLESVYLLPVMAGFLGLALFSLAFRAGTRRGYGPVALGLASACFVPAFKFAYIFDPLVYAGLLGLVAASVWNVWPMKRSTTSTCPKCARQQPKLETEIAY